LKEAKNGMSKPTKPVLKPKAKSALKPVKAWRLELGPTFLKETVDKRIAEGYTHLQFPDCTRVKIFKLTNPHCVGMKLEVGAATPEQYHLVAVMEPGWVPTDTHK
jgi:acetone carboxylase gamma subunit